MLRHTWGRWLGIVASALLVLAGLANLVSNPGRLGPVLIQLLLGGSGMFVFITSPRLFGRNRLRPADLKREFLARKKKTLE